MLNCNLRAGASLHSVQIYTSTEVASHLCALAYVLDDLEHQATTTDNNTLSG